jgi:ketosteroid isomerase-like protein
MASDSVKSGRTPDQRLATRFPPLSHAVAASVLRLPRGSRVRRAFIERTARTSFEAWVRGDYDVLRVAADPKVEVHVEMASGTNGFEVPVGLDEIYHGPDGYCESMEQWAQSFRNWRAEVDEVIEEAPDRILIIARHSGEGTASGVKLEQWGAVRYTVRHGRIVRVDAFFGPDRDGAVEASSVQDQKWAGRTAS